MHAVCAVEHFEPMEMARLTSSLKVKDVSIGRRERAVREVARRKRVRIADAQKAAQAQAARQAKAASGIKLSDVEPAEQPVPDGAVLLSQVHSFVRRGCAR